jgi:putative acetyltransferase
MNYSIRKITADDDAAVAAIIRQVMPEFGASGPGFAIHDAEVDEMSSAYSSPGSTYLVLVNTHGHVVGGGGFAQLVGADPGVCELRKMYFLPEARGKGQGARMLDQIICLASAMGYRQIYLETLTGMDAAQVLYRKMGFQQICHPLGNTGHFSCDHWFLKDLS